MLMLRRAEDRGRTKLDWLDSRHTFSFGDYPTNGTWAFVIFESSMKIV